MMQTPPIITPAHGCDVGVVVVVGGAVVVVVAGFVVVVGGAVVVVVGGAVVVVVAGLVVVVGGAVVVVVGGAVVVVVGGAVVVLDEATGVAAGSVDGTQSPKPQSKKRRGLRTTCAAKQTRSVGPTAVGCGIEGEHRSQGSPTRADCPLTVTGNGGVKRTAFREG
jgi:hypothetical protein